MNWKTVVERLGSRLYNYFIRRGFLREASDMTQDVFIRLYQKIADQQFDETKGCLDAFAFGIARFVAMEYQQSIQIQLSSYEAFDWDTLCDSSDSADLESEYHRHQIIALFLREIESLSPIQQEVISLYLDEELTIDDIAQLLNLPVGTVKSHLHRSKEKLKDLFEAKGLSI